MLDKTQVLHEHSPIESRYEAKTVDAVREGHLIRRGRAAGGFQQRLSAQTLLGQPVLEPGLNEDQRRTLALHPGIEVLDERGGQWHLGVGELRKQMNEPPWLLLRSSEHAVGPRDCRIPLFATMGYPRRHPADVFEQA